MFTARSLLGPAIAATTCSFIRLSSHCDENVPIRKFDRLPPGMLNGDVYLHHVETLTEHGFDHAHVPNRCIQKAGHIKATSGQSYSKFIDPIDCVLVDIVRTTSSKEPVLHAFPRAGPREELHFEPKKVKAAIINAGGLCPGLNNVVHHVVNTLNYGYGVQEIYGIRAGYRGLSDPNYKPLKLTPEMVRFIHEEGGSFLGTARGGYDEDKILTFLKENEINQLYVIGGDGTHRGAYALSKACSRANLNISVCGVPKTIDNDLALIDRSFGFQSAVEAAQIALKSAETEAKGNMPNGIGVVKLMGRSAGFIAAFATLGNGCVDLCLIPEVPMVLDGDKGCLPHLEGVLQQKGYAVVVVAEGAGEEVLGQSAEVDAGGNRKLPKVGDFLVDQINSYFKNKNMEATVKYIDPSYIVRSVPACSEDSYLCSILAQAAVHGAMAGYTGFSVGLVNNHTVMIPIPILVEKSPRTLNPHGRTWERVLAVTQQPNTVPRKPGEEEHSNPCVC